MQENFKRGGTALNIDKLKNDKNSQDFILMKGMPSIARRNKNEFNIFNNERFICEMIKKNKIIIKNDNDEKIHIKLEEINKIFYLDFCFTTLRAEVETIDTDYKIYQWGKMNKH